MNYSRLTSRNTNHYFREANKRKVRIIANYVIIDSKMQ